MRGKYVYPGRDCRCAESVCNPGETIDARKTGVPPDETIYCVYWIMIVYDWIKC